MILFENLNRLLDIVLNSPRLVSEVLELVPPVLKLFVKFLPELVLSAVLLHSSRVSFVEGSRVQKAQEFLCHGKLRVGQ